jgi:hypothetical protein
LLGVTRSGELRALDIDGRKASAVRDSGKAVRLEHVTDITKTREHVLVRTNEQLFVTDASSNLLACCPGPPHVGGIIVDERLLYIDGDHIMRRDRQGQVDPLCRIPGALAYEAMSRWERETRRPALAGTNDLDFS